MTQVISGAEYRTEMTPGEHDFVNQEAQGYRHRTQVWKVTEGSGGYRTPTCLEAPH